MKPKNLPKIWEEVELKKVISCIESGSRPKGGVNHIKEGVPSIGGEHLNKSGGFNFENIRFVSEEFYNEQKRGHIKNGDVLVVKDGATTGKVSIVLENNFPYKKALVNEHVFILRPNKAMVIPQFLFYYLFGSMGQRQILSNFHGSAQGGINTKFVNNVKIPLPFTTDSKPDLEKQKKIVAILEKAEKLKQKREQAIKLADEYLKSVFYEMFLKRKGEFGEVELGEIAKFINGKAFKPSEWEKEGKMIIRIQDLTGSIEKPNYTTKEFDKKYLVKKGDILISWSATLDAFIWDKEESWLNQHIFKVEEDKSKIDKMYLFYFVKRSIDLFKEKTHGSTMKHITKGKFESTKIPLPPLTLQQKFASIVEKVENMKEQQRKSKEEIENLFNALMQKAFKGELV